MQIYLLFSEIILTFASNTNVMDYTEEITCSTGKVCFRTKTEIKAYINARNKRCGGNKFHYHYCETCGCWHLTTRTPCGDYMLRKHAKHYNRLEKKSIDKSIYDLCGVQEGQRTYESIRLHGRFRTEFKKAQ